MDVHPARHNTTCAQQPLAHVMSPRQLLTVFVLLLMLTGLTVAAAGVSLGALEIWTALGIATVKAGLVAAYFMHLRYDAPLNAAIFIFALAFVALFIGLTLVDVREYQPDVLPPPPAAAGKW